MTLTSRDELKIKIEAGEPTVIVVSGELDIQGANQLREAFTATIAAGVRTIEIDLADLRFIDSTGLGVLVGAHRRLREHDGGLIVRRPSASTYRVLELTGLTRAFEIIDPPTPREP